MVDFSHYFKILIVMFLAALLPGMEGSAENVSTHFKLIREVDGIQEYLHTGNGLTVLLLEDHTSPVATVMVTYKVGSRHEKKGNRGAAHLLEHMMFKGTDRYQKQKGTQIASELQRVGAHLNATTWQDGTNYYEMIPSDQIDLALDIESDRMRNSLFRPEDLASEMHVVHSELEKIENSPLTMMEFALWDEAFRVHPYHFPIIGTREDIENTSAADLKEFYDTYYWPDNAVLTLIGDFETGTVLEKIHAAFGKVPRSQNPIPVMDKTEPPQTEKRFVKVSRHDRIEAVSLAHKIPGMVHPDTAALDILCHVLAGGKTSRLYRTLVESGMAVEMRADIPKSHDPGLFVTQVMLAPGAGHESVEKTMHAIHRNLKENGISKKELQIAKNHILGQIFYARDGSFSMAEALSHSISGGDWAFFRDYLKRIEELDTDDIREAARAWLREETLTTAWLVSKNAPERLDRLNKEPEPAGAYTSEVPVKDLLQGWQEKETPALQTAGIAIADRVHAEDAGALRIRSIRTGTEQVVTIMGSLAGAGQTGSENPVLPGLVVDLLDEGTRKHSKLQIAEMLESESSEIHFYLDHERVVFRARCLKHAVSEVVALLAEQLREPAFHEDDFLRQKQREQVHIVQSQHSTSDQASALLSRMIFPPGHPYFEVPFEEQLAWLEKTTLEDVRSFHRERYGSQGLIITAAGDVDSEVLHAAVRDAFGDWQVRSVAPPYSGLISLPSQTRRENVRIPEKSKADIVMGHALPLRRQSQDYYDAFMANFILGGDFSARLSDTVRDEHGLTYSIYSQIVGVDHRNEGYWQVSLIVNPRVLDRGIQETLKQVRLFASEGVRPEEVRDKQTTLIGRFKVSLSTTGGFAWRLHNVEEYELGMHYLDNYESIVRQISAESVNRAIAKYFHPDLLQLAVAGSIHEENASV